jgi:hypothetical protein
MDCACCHTMTKRNEEYVKVHLECWKELCACLKAVKSMLLELSPPLGDEFDVVDIDSPTEEGTFADDDCRAL